jgi:predicted negative regulator of RcsB-dependent stress response
MEDTTKSGMSNGAKLAIVGLLAIGGYFAWKYRDMIFKK